MGGKIPKFINNISQKKFKLSMIVYNKQPSTQINKFLVKKSTYPEPYYNETIHSIYHNRHKKIVYPQTYYDETIDSIYRNGGL